jgi:hypothetical protein
MGHETGVGRNADAAQPHGESRRQGVHVISAADSDICHVFMVLSCKYTIKTLAICEKTANFAR